TQRFRRGSRRRRQPDRAAPDLSKRTRTRRTAWLRVQEARNLRNVKGTRTRERRNTSAPVRRLIFRPPISSRAQAPVPENLRGAGRLTRDRQSAAGELPAMPLSMRGDSCADRAYLRRQSRELKQETQPGE